MRSSNVGGLAARHAANGAKHMNNNKTGNSSGAALLNFIQRDNGCHYCALHPFSGKVFAKIAQRIPQPPAFVGALPN
jgi:hypothetical protein